jgi:hypothetical protein
MTAWKDRKLPNGHILDPAAQVKCQMSPGGKRCRRAAKYCGYRAGPAYDYFCPKCWRMKGPDGRTPEERATH